ncbi:MAG: type II toxin-antitoxin system VapC family toxin, partial [Thermodesulfovibrionales bacterium]
MNIVIDAGVILKGYFADEAGHEYAQLIIKEYAEGLVELHAPHLIMYELVNALVVAGNRKRLGNEQINEIIAEIKEIEINLIT